MNERQRLGSAFSALLTASFITNLGDGMRLAALPLLATTLTSSPLLITSVTAAQFLPWATFAPFGGVIVDRSDRRRLIMISQAWRALIMALLGVAVLADTTSIWLLMLVAFMITVGEILVDPSVVATVPALVAPADLDLANSRITTVEVVTNEFVGAPVGAAAFAWAPWLPFLLDAISYLGSIVPFSQVRSPSVQIDAPAPRRSVRAEMGVGLR
ncbi:MAG: MFS transporter, partial [Acidimicrobiales bacterium]